MGWKRAWVLGAMLGAALPAMAGGLKNTVDRAELASLGEDTLGGLSNVAHQA